MRRWSSSCLAALIAVSAFAAAGHAQSAPTTGSDARYALAGNCYALHSLSNNKFVAKAGSGWATSASVAGGAEPIHMQATALGRYLLYTRGRDFLGTSNGAVQTLPAASDAGDWTVDVSGNGFTFTLGGKALGLSGDQLVLVDPGQAEKFSMDQTAGCADYPEAELDATGTPFTGPTPFSEVKGYIDAHMHMMAFEFLGGALHCGKPWDKFGVDHALVDCPTPQESQGSATVETALEQSPPAPDRTGWPTFPDWPKWNGLAHEQSYYRWLERSWMGGQRIFVNLMVENNALCLVYPFRKPGYDCNEMNSVRRETKDIYEMQDYIDAQAGGPGKGFFRIVTDPFEARKVINDGKLAVVLGIEVSNLFDCGLQNDQPQCDIPKIDSQLSEVYNAGIRDMELINKFDNAFGGVAGDTGSTGVVVNGGNRLETGKFWQLQTCPDNSGEDHPQYTIPGFDRDELVGAGLQLFLPQGTAPIYPAGPHCNTRGFTQLGDHLVREMMKRHMLIDPDHLDVLARKGLLDLTESKDYPGVVSSHSWSSKDAYPRIYNDKGFVAPYAGASSTFVQAWKEMNAISNSSVYQGIGWGADQNGFGAQGPPRADAAAKGNQVKYPFKSFDGGVTLDRQRTGNRVFDINKDGVAHYGLYPDWVEDLKQQAGPKIQEDLARGAEAYLQTWERAEGVPSTACRSGRGKFTKNGLFNVFLGDTPKPLLFRAGQPGTRVNRTWTWCVDGKRNGGTKVRAVFNPQGAVALVATDARGYRASRIERGARVARLKKKVKGLKKFGKGVLVKKLKGKKKLIFGVKKKRVAFIGVAGRSTGRKPKALKSYLKLAGF